MAESSRQLAVLGSPISHSMSPAIHSAAYRVLGLDWKYGAVEVAPGDLEAFLASCGSAWRGLSLTMPLKREILPFLVGQDAVSRLVGAANTVVFSDGGLQGFNTDVSGAERLLRGSVTPTPQRALILGGGATASSIVVALANLGTREIIVSTRTPEKSDRLAIIADRLGVIMTVGDLNVDPGMPDVVVSTLPGTTPLVREFSEALRNSAPLIDIAYNPWPTALAQHWIEGGGVVDNGLGMLVYQALIQVRIFVGGDPERELPGEAEVLGAMRSAAIGSS